MKSLKRSYWMGIPLALLLIMMGRQIIMSPSITLQKPNTFLEIETVIEGVQVKQFDTNGKLSNILTTPLIQYFPENHLHLLKTPHIVITQEDQSAWEIDSLKAKSFENGTQITFIEKVVVRQNSGKNEQESTLKTEEVTYYPKEKKATTSLFVTFEQTGNIIQSRGMNAYLDEKRVELLHQARGSYVPSQG